MLDIAVLGLPEAIEKGFISVVGSIAGSILVRSDVPRSTSDYSGTLTSYTVSLANDRLGFALVS